MMVEIIQKPTSDEFCLILEKPKRHSSDKKVLIKRKKEQDISEWFKMTLCCFISDFTKEILYKTKIS